MTPPPAAQPQIIPYLYYEDAGPAIEFMERAFGFEIVFVFHSPSDGRVLHCTLRTGSGDIFVGPGMKPFGTHGTPDPDFVTSMTYVYVDDIEAHHARAKAAGAQIREELHEHVGGNRQYTASDPGGQRWTFAELNETSDEVSD